MNKLDNNFDLLINRKQGQLFDVKEGSLVEMPLYQKIRYIVQKSYRQAVQERLKPVVSSLAGRITDERQLQSLKRLPPSIFERTALSAAFHPIHDSCPHRADRQPGDERHGPKGAARF